VKQVDQILRQNKEKLLKRSQLKREDYKILGKVPNRTIQKFKMRHSLPDILFFHRDK
jgi:hypothetical protein